MHQLQIIYNYQIQLFFSIFNFLSFDFKIGTVIHALSSRKIFAVESFSIASPICAKSELSKFHFDILYIGTHETSDIILSTIDSTLISK